MSSTVTAVDWIKGITFSILASMIGSASKLAIRKSWLLEFALEEANSDESSSPLLPAAAPASSASPEVAKIRASYSDKPYHRALGSGEMTWKGVLRDVVGDQDDAVAKPTQDLDNDEEEELDEIGWSYHRQVTSSEADVDENDDNVERGEEEEIVRDVRRFCRCRRRKGGWLPWSLRFSGLIGMTFLNPLCCVLAMRYASPSILAPFSGLTLVWVVLLSRALIGEEPTFRQKIGAVFIVAGEIMVAVFGDHTNEEDMTIDDVRRSYGQLPFILYLLGVVAWMLCLCYWMTSPTTSLYVRRFAWGVSGGSVTGLQNFLKDALTIGKAQSKSTEADSDDEEPWLLTLFIILAVLSAFGGLLLLTACMKRYDATYSSAMFVGSFVVSASIMSVVHYDTFGNLGTIWSFFFYPLGFMILMVGVYILVRETREHLVGDMQIDNGLTNGSTIPVPTEWEPLCIGQDNNEVSLT